MWGSASDSCSDIDTRTALAPGVRECSMGPTRRELSVRLELHSMHAISVALRLGYLRPVQAGRALPRYDVAWAVVA